MGLPNRKVERNRYMELFEEFPLKPIRNDRDLTRAEKVLQSLLDVEDLDRDERDYLEVLGGLMSEYETKNHPIEDVTESEMLAHLIEVKGINQRTVAEATGLTESLISDLLSGRREFTRNNIRKLSTYFGVSPAVFFPNVPKTA